MEVLIKHYFTIFYAFKIEKLMKKCVRKPVKNQIPSTTDAYASDMYTETEVVVQLKITGCKNYFAT